MVLQIYTAQYNVYCPSNRIDITIKNGNKVFAPSWKIVIGYKKGEITTKEYTEIYLKMMEKSQIVNKTSWQALLEYKSPIYLACMCRAYSFCHRYLLAKLLVEKYNAEYLGEYGCKKPMMI